jgi:acyl-CoA synthetase (NDP forming)
MMSIYEQLRPVFYPKSIAIAGISLSNPTHWTRYFFNALIDFNFHQLYLVNPKGGEIGGHKVYHSIDEVPGEIEYVISTVAARVAPDLMRQCANKGVKVVHFCTSGFAETGEEEGIRLEAEILRLSRETGIRIIGPNCMGIYCPESHVAFETFFPKESGSVGVISQSGGNASQLVEQAAWRGVRFSRLISFGNACDLNETDFLEYLTKDPKTSIIAMYLEGVKDGERFLKALKQAAGKKTIVLFKGGVTRGGAQATLGHTGSLAGNETIWDALSRQYRVTRVASMDEMTDVLVTLLFFPLPKGRRAILIGSGGGISGKTTDLFEKNGLYVPQLPQDIKDQIRSFTPIAGNIIKNPLDVGGLNDIDKLAKIARIVTDWKGSDLLVTFFNVKWDFKESTETMRRLIKEIRKATATSHKPIAVVQETNMPDKDAIMYPIIQYIASLEIPVYQSFEGAARGIDLVLKHNHI